MLRRRLSGRKQRQCYGFRSGEYFTDRVNRAYAGMESISI